MTLKILLKNINDEIRENETYSLKLINIIKDQKNQIQILKKEQKNYEENKIENKLENKLENKDVTDEKKENELIESKSNTSRKPNLGFGKGNLNTNKTNQNDFSNLLSVILKKQRGIGKFSKLSIGFKFLKFELS